AAFMAAFRSAVGAATGLEVKSGERITPGIAGSLDPELAVLIAEVDASRYAVSGEVARVAESGGTEYAVNLIVVDSQVGRATDLISAPFDPAAPAVARSGLEVKSGERITPGIAGSLDPELAVLIAEVDASRYAVSGEVARVAESGGTEYAVNLIVVDSQVGRATDLISAPFDPAAPAVA